MYIVRVEDNDLLQLHQQPDHRNAFRHVFVYIACINAHICNVYDNTVFSSFQEDDFHMVHLFYCDDMLHILPYVVTFSTLR